LIFKTFNEEHLMGSWLTLLRSLPKVLAIDLCAALLPNRYSLKMIFIGGEMSKVLVATYSLRL
jgi:hypothetical protein